MIGDRINLLVIGLGRAEQVVVDGNLLAVVVTALRICRIATVVETHAIARPADRRELGADQYIVGIASTGYVPHAPGLPVAAAIGEAVGHEAAIRTQLELAQRDRAIGVEAGRIDQHGTGLGQVTRDAQQVLLRLPGVPGVGVHAILALRQAHALVIEQRPHPRREMCTGGQRGDLRFGVAVLCSDPVAKLSGPGVFHPAEGIGHSGAMVDSDLFDLARDRICGTHGRRPRQLHRDQYEHADPDQQSAEIGGGMACSRRHVPCAGQTQDPPAGRRCTPPM